MGKETMPKGLCATFCAVAMLTAPFCLQAQVYRCETSSGTVFSDKPCGANAEEIEVQGVVMDMKGVGGEVAAPPINPPEEAATESAEAQPEAAPAPAPRAPSPESAAYLNNPANAGSTDEQYLTDFLAMLKTQRQEQIGEIDDRLSALKRQVGEAEKGGMTSDLRAELEGQIASLESNKLAILSEYEALIAEAEARLQ